MRSIGIAVAVLLAGCSTAVSIMEGYVGEPIEKPIAQYGPPANSFDMPDGRRAFQWLFDSSGAIPMPTTTTTTAFGTGGSATAVSTGTTMMPFSQRCFYTLYAEGSEQEGWIVSGYETPRAACQ